MADPIRWESKDPDAVVPRGFNWTPKRWGDDEILTITAVVVSGTVAVASSAVADPGEVPGARPGQGTIHWLTGGTADAESTIRLRAVTRDGRTEDQTMIILCETK
jgi:hypothetical protein